MDPILGCHFGKDKRMGIADVIRHLHAQFQAKCGQIFVGSPQSPSMPDSLVAKWIQESDAIRTAREECDGFKLYIHAPYTLNFCMKTDREERSDKYWITALMARMRIADAMGAEGCVLHMGKAVKLGKDEAEDIFHANIVEVLDGIKAEGIKSKLIIETSAGQGTELYPTTGDSLDPLARFYSRFTASQKKHLRLCVDTCHIFAAGYNIGTDAGSKKFWTEWEDKLGLECLGVVHMNNSMKGLGSRVDRHAPLAGGAISLNGLSAFAKGAAQAGVPMVIETPLCQFDIEVLSEFISKTPATLNKRDWATWFKERQLDHMFANLGA